MRTLSIAIAVLSLWACNGPKEVAETSEQTSASKTDTIVMVVETPATPIDSLVISFSKTPCFGRCPVYKVKVYESGFATYEGLNFAEKLGLYSYHFSPEEIEAIYQSAVAIEFFELDAEYNEPMVSDLPSTKTRIHWNGQDHRVRASINIPEKLKIFHSNLAVTLLEKNWKTYSDR